MFGPLRVDVVVGTATATGATAASEQSVNVYQTFWGNEWGNKGEYKGGAKTLGDAEEVRANVEIRPERVKEFYQERQGCE